MLRPNVANRWYKHKFTIIRRNVPAAAYYALKPPRQTGFKNKEDAQVMHHRHWSLI